MCVCAHGQICLFSCFSVSACSDLWVSQVHCIRKPVLPVRFNRSLRGFLLNSASFNGLAQQYDKLSPLVRTGSTKTALGPFCNPYTICLYLQKRPVEDGDRPKNVEAMSGMEGRKKMFDAGSAQWYRLMTSEQHPSSVAVVLLFCLFFAANVFLFCYSSALQVKQYGYL